MLEKIFGSGGKVALLRAMFKESSKSFLESELASKAKVTFSEANRQLPDLVKEGVLDMKRQGGKAKIYSINKSHPLSKVLNDLFSAESVIDVKQKGLGIIVDEVGANLYILPPYTKFFMSKQIHEKIWKLKFNATPIAEIKAKRLRWALDIEEYKKAGQNFIEQLKDEKRFNEVKIKTLQAYKELEVYGLRLEHTNFKHLNNNQLCDMYDGFEEKYMYAIGWGFITTIPEYYTLLISEELERILKNKKLSRSLSEYFVTLTTPLDNTAMQREDLTLLDIALEIQKNKQLAHIFSSPQQEIISKLESSDIGKEILSKIKKHAHDYGWVTWGYEGPGWNENYFITALTELLNKKINLEEHIKLTHAEVNKIKETQREMLAELKLSKEELKFIDIARLSTILKILRKEAMFFCFSRLQKLQDEIASRLAMPVQHVKYMIGSEIREALTKSEFYEIPRKKYAEREQHCAFVVENGKIVVLERDEAEKVSKMLGDDTVNESVEEIRGTPAYIGIASGRIVHVNTPSDMEKFKQGDVLVSIATNPELVPAMKKASAIITDMGGITCHAAIISRELKVPCIVGTKVASKVLKEGTMVEVDGRHGVVRIIK